MKVRKLLLGLVLALGMSSADAQLNNPSRFTVAGDSGTNQVIQTNKDTLTLEGGPGIDTIGATPDKITIQTDSQEASFLKDGNSTNLICSSSSDAGKMQVLDNGTVEFCDGVGGRQVTYTPLNVKAFNVDCTGSEVADTTFQNALNAAAGKAVYIPPNCTILVQGPASPGVAFTVPANTSIIGGSSTTSIFKLAGKVCQTNGSAPDAYHGLTPRAACTNNSDCGGSVTGTTCAYDGNATRRFGDVANTLFKISSTTSANGNVLGGGNVYSDFGVNAQGIDGYGRCSTTTSQACYGSIQGNMSLCPGTGSVTHITDNPLIKTATTVNVASTAGFAASGSIDIPFIFGTPFPETKTYGSLGGGGTSFLTVQQPRTLDTPQGTVVTVGGQMQSCNSSSLVLAPVGTASINIFDQDTPALHAPVSFKNINIFDHKKGSFDITWGVQGNIDNFNNTNTLVQDPPTQTPAANYEVDYGVKAVNTEPAIGTLLTTVVSNSVIRANTAVVTGVGMVTDSVILPTLAPSSTARHYGIIINTLYSQASHNKIICSGGAAIGIAIQSQQQQMVSSNNIYSCFNGIKVDCVDSAGGGNGNITIDHNRINYGGGAKITLCGFGNYARGNYLAWGSGSVKTCKGGISGTADDRKICTVNGDCTSGVCEQEPIIRMGWDGIYGGGTGHAGIVGNLIHSEIANTIGILYSDVGLRCTGGTNKYKLCTVANQATDCPGAGGGTCSGIFNQFTDSKIAENQFWNSGTGASIDASQLLIANGAGMVNNSWDENHFFGSADTGIALPTTANAAVATGNYFSNNFCNTSKLCIANFVRSMGISKDNFPNQADTPLLQERRQWTFQQRDNIGGAPTTQEFGIDSAVNLTVSSAAPADDTSSAGFNYIKLTTGTGNPGDAKWISSRYTLVQPNQQPVFAAVIKTGVLGSGATGSRLIVGLTSADPIAAAASHGMYFRYDTATDGTAYWRCVTNNGSAYASATITTSTQPIADSTRYHLRISWDGTYARFYVNDNLACPAQSATPPTSTQALGYIVGFRSLSATDRNLFISKIAMEHF